MFSEEEEEGEEEDNDRYNFHGESTEKDHLVADIIHGGESLVFLHDNSFYRDQDHVQEFVEPQKEHVVEDQDESFDTAQHSEHDDDVSDVREEQIPARDNRSGCTSDTNNGGSSFPVVIDPHNKSVLVESDESSDGIFQFY